MYHIEPMFAHIMLPFTILLCYNSLLWKSLEAVAYSTGFQDLNPVA